MKQMLINPQFINEDKTRSKLINSSPNNQDVNFILQYAHLPKKKKIQTTPDIKVIYCFFEIEYSNNPVLGFNFEVDTYNTTYAYDTVDNLVNITDTLGNAYTFSYDSLGRRISLTDPDLGNWTYTYDLAGNLITQKQVGGGNLISGDGFYREYDGLNQLIKIRNGSSANSGQIENYTYDPFGQRIKIARNDSARTIIKLLVVNE